MKLLLDTRIYIVWLQDPGLRKNDIASVAA